MRRRAYSQFFWSVIAILFLAQAAHATPYASAVSVSAGTVTFILNEAADNVTVVLDGGVSSQDLGALDKGTHTFALGTATTFQIVVKKDAGAGYTQGAIQQISSDSNALVRFNSPRGVAVNKNPSSPAFGRIFVANSHQGTVSGRTLEDGIYALNADQTEIPALGTNALTGGLVFNTGTGNTNQESPHRLTFGPDDMLYIGDWSDTSGSLYVTDVNVANGQNVLGGPTGSPFPVGATRIHGSISGAWIEGSLAAGDLTVYVIDEDLQDDPASATQNQRNSIWQWNIGSGPLPTTTPPTRIPSGLISFAGQLADITRAADGKFYVSQRRASGNEAGVIVRSADGLQTLWSSLNATRSLPGLGTAPDLLTETAAIDLSPDGKWLAALRRDTNSITLLPIVDGLPDITNRLVLITTPFTGLARDIGFDAAGNLYYVSSGQGLMRVFSPGGKTTATTGSDGTFAVQVAELAKISVSAPDNSAFETGPDDATFTITRTGDLSQSVTVDFALAGTATAGDDYPTVPLSVTLAPGQGSADIVITPTDDAIAELQESIQLNLQFSTNYVLMSPTNASAFIADNEPTTLRLSATRTNLYEPLPGIVGMFTVTRLGDTNIDIFNVSFAASGTASHPADFYYSTNEFYFDAFLVSSNLTLHSVNDFELEGFETVTLALVDSDEYQHDPANTISFQIRDDDAPPARVLFADDLNNDTSANWQMRFGANNGIFDATVEWGYDYGALLQLPPAPDSADFSTRGLRIAVNKADATARGSAGINFYPVGQSFGGDYALRFDMFLSFGTVSTTEHALAGLNHTGDFTVRATQSTDAGNSTAGGDGVWINIVTDASNLRDYAAYSYPTPASLPQILTNRPASTVTSLVTRPPYAFAGSPGSTGTSLSWAEVELRQVNNTITLSVNDNVIFDLPNTTGFTGGNIMIGHNDQFDSIGSPGNFVIFDNVRVVSLAFEITSVQLLANNEVQIDFSSPNGEAANAFTLQSRPALGTGIWEDDSNAVITSVAPGQYRAVTTRSGGERYYQIVK